MIKKIDTILGVNLRWIKNVDILWTGGWDSTYRMIEFSRTTNIVQPIYLW